MLNVQSTTIFTNEAFSKLLNSFGVLFTPENSMPFYGILAQSEIFDHRVTKNHYHCYTVIGPQISAIDIEKNFLNYSGLKQENILAIFPHSWDKALPIYNYDRQLAVEKIEHYLNSLHKPWLFFGNYIEAIGLKNLVQGAYTLAENLRQN